MFEKVLKDSTFRKVLIIFVIEKILILAVGFLAFYLVPADISYKDNVTDNIFLNPWAQIDSQSYLDIAKNGYNAQFGLAGNYGWYPFYPFLIRIFSFIGVELAAFMISNIASFLAVVVVYLIIKEEFGNRIAGRSVFYILFFPSAYFLTAMYTEPLFLLLASSMFYFARKENWVYVGLLGFLISMTRMQGILMFFPMLYLFYIKHKFSPKILLLLLIPLGLFSFMLYQHAITGDMFIQFRSQEAYQRSITFPLFALTNEFFNLVNMINFTDFIYNFSNLSVTIFLIIILYVGWKGKYVKNEYLIYLAIMLIFPMFSGTLSAMSRFAIMMFPAFIIMSALSEKERKYNMLFKAIYVIFIFILVFSTVRYVNEDINFCRIFGGEIFCRN